MIKNKYKELIEIKDVQLNNYKETERMPNEKLEKLKSEYLKQSAKLDNKEYCISCYKEKLQNNNAEIKYLKDNNSFGKKIISPLAYLLLLSKSKFREIKVNIELYRALKNSDCFDIGYYLKKYPDLSKSKWCTYFSPELHFVCKGFDEHRKFNEKCYTNNKKKLIRELLRSN